MNFYLNYAAEQFWTLAAFRKGEGRGGAMTRGYGGGGGGGGWGGRGGGVLLKIVKKRADSNSASGNQLC